MSSQSPSPPQGTQADDGLACLSHRDTAPAVGPEIEEQDQPKRKKRVRLKDDEKKALLVKQCCFHFKLYPAGKENFYREMQKIIEQKTGIDVNVKSFLQSRVPERRKEVAKDLEKSGVARHFGDFELALDQWISLVDSAAEKVAADEAAKKDEVSRALRPSSRLPSNITVGG